MVQKPFRAVLAAVVLAVTALGGTAGADAPPRSYIVVLAPGTTDVPEIAADLAGSHGGRVGHVYEHALRGFSITVPPQAAAALARNPQVAYVEADDVVSIEQTTPTGIRRIFADTNAGIDIDGSDDHRVDVDVAVLDTGVDFEHPDLVVAGGVTCALSGNGPRWDRQVTCEPGGNDDHYHGTHVAGTVAALDNGDGVVGVAPGARIWAVKVLDSNGSGSLSQVIAGIDWVAANADTIEVANMSLGGSGWSQAQYDAIQGAVDAGVAFAVAAGNSDADASGYSPAAFDNVLTVSALADFDGLPGGLGSPTCRADQDDTLADFSNWGAAVGLAAPGTCILSTIPVEQGGYGTISGTSMASPHAAGALALLASTSPATDAAGVDALYAAVIDSGNTDWTDDSGDGTKEPLLDVSDAVLYAPALVAGGASGEGAGETSDATPEVTITSPADGATVDAGATVLLEGSATDTEDGDLSGSIAWTSSVDGALGTGGSVTTTLSSGTHAVTAAVTDSNGTTAEATVTVTVADPPPSSGITLLVDAWKDRGNRYATLDWSGTDTVDVYRDGGLVAAGVNAPYVDGPLGKGGGSATYQVCEAGTTTCSSEVAAVW